MVSFFLSNIPPSQPVLLIMDGYGSHVSIDVIQLAQDNDVHLLCLPAHTTHILQPLNVGVFKSNFSKACTKYLAAHPGRVVTSDKLASLVAEAWPHSFTALNIMSGFKKCGIFPINPSEITDRQIAPSKAVRYKTGAETDADDVPTSPLFSPEKEDLYKKRYEEGYNVDDPDYIAWLKINHPTSVSSIYSGSSSFSVIVSTGFQSPSSRESSAGVLADVLVLPHPTAGARKKCKPALNSKAVCITEDEVLEELKKKENEKAQIEKEKEVKKLDRIQKREEKRLETERRKREKAEKMTKRGKESKKTHSAKETNEETASKASMEIVTEFATLELSSASAELDDAICQKCGVSYADRGGLWVCCDGCDRWFNIECTNIRKKKIPDVYYCTSP